jgi:hypothetical protein
MQNLVNRRSDPFVTKYEENGNQLWLDQALEIVINALVNLILKNLFKSIAIALL